MTVELRRKMETVTFQFDELTGEVVDIIAIVAYQTVHLEGAKEALLNTYRERVSMFPNLDAAGRLQGNTFGKRVRTLCEHVSNVDVERP